MRHGVVVLGVLLWPLLVVSCAVEKQEAIQQDLDQAQAAWKKQDYSLAAAELGRAIQEHPDERLYELQGDAYQASGNLSGAIGDYTYLIQNYDPTAEYYGQRSILYAESGDFQSGLADTQEMVRLAPNSYMSYAARGFQYEMLSQYDDAIADFSHAMKLAPDHPSPLIQRGFAYGLAGNYVAAEKDFETALRIAPDVAIANAALAWLRATCPVASLRSSAQAQTYAIRACILTKWDDPLSLSALAAAHAENGDFKRAADWQGYAISKTLPAASTFLQQEKALLSLYVSGQPNHSDFSSIKPALVWISVPP